MGNLMRNRVIVWLFRNRLALLAVLLVLEAQFFVINLINSFMRSPDAGWELRIPIIDNNLTPQGLWLIPYIIGFVLSAALPLWASFVMPIKLYRQFVLSMAVAAAISYTIYVLFPTYVTKPEPEEVKGSSIFAIMLRNSYDLDAAASTHNAAPSQHVFYALINMCYMIRFRPRGRVFVLWVALGTLISASTLMTMRHNSPDLIMGYLTAVLAYAVGLRLGERITDELGDSGTPVPPAPWARLRFPFPARPQREPLPRQLGSIRVKSSGAD